MSYYGNIPNLDMNGSNGESYNDHLRVENRARTLMYMNADARTQRTLRPARAHVHLELHTNRGVHIVQLQQVRCIDEMRC